MGDEEDVDFRLNHHQVLAEISDLLQSTAEPGGANALLLNQEMQRRLKQVRRKILELLQIVKARYARNEDILVRRLKSRSHFGSETLNTSGAILRKGTFLFKGNLYFRDVDGRSCPNNDDYETRCHTEMFPSDFDMRSRHVWTLKDKKNVIMGIKQQLLDHSNNRIAEQPSSSRKRKPVERHVITLVNLLTQADSSFSIDWNQISTLDVEYRHSPFSCEAMWSVYLRPDLRRDDWSPEEDESLISAVTANRMQNWALIADMLDRRSDYQCFVRFHSALRHNVESKGVLRWTDQENERLRMQVERNTSNNIINWQNVAEYFPGRSKSTLIGRYFYVLHPSISHEPFTTKEDMMLFAAVEEYNGKFHCFPRTLFPNRSLAQLRTRYHNVLAQRNKTDSWSVRDDTRLMAFVTEHGPSQWVKCATFLGNHSRTSCRTRFMVIKQFLERNPSATVEDLPRRKSKKVSVVTSDNWAQRLEEWQKDPASLVAAADEKRKLSRLRKPKSKRPRVELDIDARMAKIDLDFRDFLKYAYNLAITQPAVFSLPQDSKNFVYVARALAYKPPKLPVTIQSCVLPKELIKSYNIMMKNLPDDGVNDAQSPLLPPSFSTMMGFRSICILSGEGRKQDSDSESQAYDDYDESSPAIQLFRMRLRALFYRTTLLSRLESTLFTNLPSALTKCPRPATNYIQLGSILTEGESRSCLKSEPLSEDEIMSTTVKQEMEVDYIIP
ncbi:myb-like protein L [Drosophila serrata]|uniref:myb-like protein L n=1 Tax=Drosophila serrata TaxID=7274 RepID=UPI000A1D0B95|nr:myb-like protein L [Drosophila serrata]